MVQAMRLHLRPFLGKYNASQRPDDTVSHVRVQIPTLSAHCIIQQQACRPVCLGNCDSIRQELPVIGDAKQATSEEKSDPVE